MWFARFQILIFELQSNWYNFLVLKWLYRATFFFPNYFFSKNQHSFDSANLRTFILYWQIWIKINIEIFFWTIFGLRLLCVWVLHVSLNEVPKVNWEFPASIYPIRLSWSFRNWLSCPSQSPAKDLAQETEKNLDKIQKKRE